MRRIRELVRLHFGAGASARSIARELGVSRSTVKDYLARAAAAQLTWPLPEGLTDAVLEERLFAAGGAKPGMRRRIEPDWSALVREMKRPGVNLTVLWEEYGAAHPGGYGYSRFCELYREFERRLSPTMRQHHIAGDKVFVDYSGKTVPIVDRTTGEVRPAQLFIGVLGASSYTFADVSWTQTLPDWIAAHVRMFAFFQGCPRLVVPDNLKSGVHKPSFYDPELNRTYARMAAHYGVGILPARPRKPRDKAKVEAGVRLTQSYILGRLRHVTFFSLIDCRSAVQEALKQINERPMRRLGTSRHQLFEAIERSALQPLPASRYVGACPRAGLLARPGGRMAVGPRRSGLSRRDREFLLFGAARPDPRTGRLLHQRAHHRDLPSRPARRHPSAALWRPPSRHRSRAHAQRPSPLCGVDTGTLPALGARDRPEHRRTDHRRPRAPAAP